MKRRAFGRQTLSVSLFPFLAVLICTMGVIIVMLVIVVRQATARAAVEVVVADEPAGPAEPTEEQIQQHQEALQDIAWERDVLAQQRDERVAELAKIRQHMAHVEDHLRRLQQQAQQLLQQARDIDEGKHLDNAQLQAARDELARKQAEIAAAEEEIAKLKKQRSIKDRWYALLPYEGPNGTRRRPVYIECTEAGIVLQPEGLVLMPDDFNGPMGPGNPLDAVLKAKREYLERNGEKGLPYPLLIVRPDGIVAYMVARSALKSWEEEFGYELIDNEKKLVFGEPDPALAQQLAQTVRQARQRQALMVASMPRKYQPEDNLNSFNTSEMTSQMPEMQMAGRGVTGGNGPAGGGVGTGGYGTGGIGSGPGTNFASGSGRGMGSSAPDQPLGNGGSNPANSLRDPGSGTTGGGQPGTNAFGGNSTTVQAGTSGSPGSGDSSAGTGSSNGSNAANGGTSGATGGSSGSAGSSQWSNVASGGQGGSAGATSQGQPGGGNTFSVNSGSSQSNGQSSSQSNGQSSTSSAGRGHNWGLLNSNGRTVAVSRPIRVACQGHQIVVLPDLGDADSPIVIPLANPQLTDKEVIAFVEAVQKRIGSWGIAAENGYWRPQLSMDVSANADPRFQQWEQALNGSGYEIKRKQR